MTLKAMISQLRADWIEILQGPEMYGASGNKILFLGLSELLKDLNGVEPCEFNEGVMTYLRGRARGIRPNRFMQHFLNDDELRWCADVLEFLEIKLVGWESKS